MRFRHGILSAGVLAAMFLAGGGVTRAAEEGEGELPQVQLALLLDTSGSMSGLIDQARQQLWKVVNEFATAKLAGKSPQLRVALYEYGNSGLDGANGYIREIVPLTDDLDTISEELFKLTTNGGSEHCGQVIDRAVKDLKWSEGERDLKCIFIAGNEPFTQGPIDYREACKAAAEKGITVSTIFCGDHAEGLRTLWADGARLADGSFMSIDQNQAIVQIESPHDEELVRLSSELNETYVAYGKVEDREAAQHRQVAQDVNALNLSQQAAAMRCATKGGQFYNNASWDLVDACKQNLVKLEDLKEAELPAELQKLSVDERKAFVEKKTNQRTELQTRIAELSKQREVFVAEELKKLAGSTSNTLDKAILDAVRVQCERKNYSFAN